jgi:hypothetical protein
MKTYSDFYPVPEVFWSFETGEMFQRCRMCNIDLMIKGTPMSQCEEHQIYGWFIDKDIVFTGMPYMLSSEVIDELLSLLSNETIGVLEDFSEKLFGIDIPKGLVSV